MDLLKNISSITCSKKSWIQEKFSILIENRVWETILKDLLHCRTCIYYDYFFMDFLGENHFFLSIFFTNFPQIIRGFLRFFQVFPKKKSWTCLECFFFSENRFFDNILIYELPRKYSWIFKNIFLNIFRDGKIRNLVWVVVHM